MTTSLTSQEKQTVNAAVVQKAVRDNDFRAALVQNPAATVEAFFGRILPAGTHVHLLEENATQLYLVLPPLVAPTEEQEIVLEELEAVAGGLDNGQGMCTFSCMASCFESGCWVTG